MFPAERLCIVIHSAGDPRPHLCTELSTPGSSGSPTSSRSCSKTMRTQDGFQLSSRRSVLRIGSQMLGTGASLETDIGVILFLSGPLTTWKRLSALAPSRNCRSSQDAVTSPISTEKTSTTLPSLPNKARASSRESQRYSTAGSRVAPCPTLKATIHSPSTMLTS